MVSWYLTYDMERDTAVLLTIQCRTVMMSEIGSKEKWTVWDSHLVKVVN